MVSVTTSIINVINTIDIKNIKLIKELQDTKVQLNRNGINKTNSISYKIKKIAETKKL